MAELLRRAGDFRWLPLVHGRAGAHDAPHARTYQADGLVPLALGIGALPAHLPARDRRDRAIVAEELPSVRFHLFVVALRLLPQRGVRHPATVRLHSSAGNSRVESGIPTFNMKMLRR